MLLSRPQPFPNECVVGYLLRVAELNGFKHLGILLRYAGLRWKNNRAPIHSILSGQFDLTPLLLELGLPDCQFRTPALYQPFKQSIDTPYFLVKHPKVCPDCLKELKYCKYEWSLLPVIACCKHKKMLIDFSFDTGNRLTWYRQHINQFDGELSTIKSSETLAPPNALKMSLYIESHLLYGSDKMSIPTILKGLTLRESLSLIHLVAHFQRRLLGATFHPVSMLNSELSQCYQNVWEVFQEWPSSLYELLNQYLDKPMSQVGMYGITTHFRDLYERLYRQQQNRGIRRIKEEFERYIEAFWPGVLDPERLKRIQLTSYQRNIISRTDCAKIIGCRLERLDRLIQQEILTEVVFKGRAHYLREQVISYRTRVMSNWTMNKACNEIQLTRYQLKQLLDAGIIKAIHRPSNLNRDWLIDKAKCQKLIDGLRLKAKNPTISKGGVSKEGIQKQGFSIVELVLAMQKGEIEYEVLKNGKHSDSFKQFINFKISVQSDLFKF